MMIEGSTHQNIAILNLYGWNNVVSKYTKQTLIELQAEIGKLTTIMEDLEYLSQ